MEKLTSVPFYKRFGFRVLLFDAIILLSIISTTVIIGRQNYKTLTDRISFHTALFADLVRRLQGFDENDWSRTISSFPGVLPQQRVTVFTVSRKLVYDSGIMRDDAAESNLLSLFPDPYINWSQQDHHFDPSVLITYLKRLNVGDVDPRRPFVSTRTIQYPKGLDRILLSGRLVSTASGRQLIVVMTDSVVDILIHNRGVKERFLVVYSLIAIFSLLLTLVFTRSVTSPLKRLYTFSRQVLASRGSPPDPMRLPTSGEIGEICGALQRVMTEQKARAESFARFSSDVVHELKTPLAAIRAGLDVCTESTDSELIGMLYGRINRRIVQMENVMSEIRLIGKLESSAEDARCDTITAICGEVLSEFENAAIRVKIDPAIGSRSIPVSCEKLSRILRNLIKNAVSFSPRTGSVSMNIEADTEVLSIRVSDKGPGIAQEVFAHIVDRFVTYRPDGTEKHSGLGLSIVNTILRNIGGHLQYRNCPEGGAEFDCMIPFLDC